MLPPQEYMGAFTFFVENIKADLESYSNLLFAVVLLAMITIGFLVIKMKKSMDEQQKMTRDYETIKIRSENSLHWQRLPQVQPMNFPRHCQP